MNASQQIDQLNQQFGLGSRLSFHIHPSGLIYGAVSTEQCQGTIFLNGAHVTHFHPQQTEKPVLFMSEQSNYMLGKAIRGGIPICFPWFGNHPTDSTLPAHGWARTSQWKFAVSNYQDDVLTVQLTLLQNPFELTYTVRFGTDLEAQLSVSNCSTQDAEFEVALHTYFAIGAIDSVEVHGGLESLPFLDQLTGQYHPATRQPIRFTEETDRIYDGAPNQIQLHDSKWHRQVNLTPENSHSTVVWNPWIAKSQRMPDFGDLEYLGMCCLETANVRKAKVILKPSASHTTGLRLSACDKASQ
jgi:D-hexose-6-phosphate mutarotase